MFHCLVDMESGMGRWGGCQVRVTTCHVNPGKTFDPLGPLAASFQKIWDKALVPSSVALVSTSFLLLLVRHLFLVAMHLFQ